MKVLSVLDGISCGQVALKKVGIKVDQYFSSEIDKYAISVTEKNYKNTIQLGDIKLIKGKDLPRIDLLIGGSPCQGFSVAGDRLNFNDPRSQLFFEYLRLLKECNPKYFLLENVKMKKEWKDIITECMGVEPILINSALVSAQNRQRLYWTNIPNIEQPEDRGILLKDILENSGGKGMSDNMIILSEKAMAYMNRITSKNRNHWDFKHHSDVSNEKSSAVVANFYKGIPYNVLIDYECVRHLTPIECERLQTLPDNYTEGISKTQRYKSIGNGWTVDVIAHILRNIDDKRT